MDVIYHHDYLPFHTPMSMNVSTISHQNKPRVTNAHISMCLTHRKTVCDMAEKFLLFQLPAHDHSVSRLKCRITFLYDSANLLLRLMTQNKNIKGHSKSRDLL